jgi:TolB-like protein
MIFVFDQFELDARTAELRKAGKPVPLEPQVFALLLLLVENRDRLITKDEIIEKVWDGRIVSDSALTSRIKTARQALGDDGKAQRFIKTVHGKGVRFVGDAKEKSGVLITTAGAPTAIEAPPVSAEISTQPSIAVLPFRLVGVAGPYAAIADALPQELISELSRMRWLFVIARGSTFRFRAVDPDIVEVGRALDARYCLTGVVEIVGDRVGITVELSDTLSVAVLWGERFASRVDDIHLIREEIVRRIVTALEVQIPLHEAQAARLKSPEHLDAWAAYHLGLQHLYRFNRSDNDIARSMFERAVIREPDFARAHAGLSSAHFQNAFLNYSPDPAADRKLARRHAERGIEADPLDPFANFVMGRVFWIEDEIAGATSWLDRAVSLSPNFAQGFYARAWTDAISGDGRSGADDVDLALSLSPLDPFRYAMLGVRAFTYMQRGEDKEAARWAEESARAPGAHVLIAAIALAANALAGDRDRAGRWAANVRDRKPDLTQADFFRAFPFENPELRRRISNALTQFGF